MTLRAPHFSKPRLRKVQAPQVLPSLLLTTLAMPFVLSELTVPQTQITQQPLQLGMPLVILENAGEKPFNQSDWPNPQIPIVQEPVNRGTLLPLTTVPRTIIALDWPNPTVAVKVQTPFQVGVPLTILEDAGEKPFTQLDWPNPILPPIPITQYPGSSIDLLTTIVEVGARIAGISLSMSTNEILLREKHPNIRLKQIASKIVFRE